MSGATDRLVDIMDRLRDPGGCPWDREQTLESLTGYLLEEAHEVVAAVASGRPELLCEELGDLLLQIVFMARIAKEQGWFDLDGVCDAISDKMIRRHPHVFGSADVADADEVVRNWEDIKQDERKEQPDASALDGIPTALPGLLKAFRMTEKAAALGFDWQRPADVVGKLHEEVEELESALLSGNGSTPVREELGDILFVMANLARHLGIEPETALQRTNRKFMRRFRSMEDQARAAGRSLRSYDLQGLDSLWQEAKRLERK